MKKQHLFLVLSATLLASCGNGGNTRNSSLESSAPISSMMPSKSFEELMAKLVETKSYTVKKYYQVVGADSRQDVGLGITKQYGPKALAQYDIDSGKFLSGEIIHLHQGVFSYSYAGDEFVLGDFEKLCGDKEINDLYYTPLAFSNMENWYKKADGVTYETMDGDTMDAICTVSGLMGMANSMMIQFDYMDAQATVEGDTITILMDAYFDIELGPVAAAKVVISDIGETKDEKIENYLKNPTEVAARTAWSDAQKASIGAYFGGEKAIELPFPNKASYALNVTGQSAYNEVMVRDYLSGDIRSSYGVQLIRAGFENITESGSKANVYEKTVEDENGVSTYDVYVSYSSQADIATNYGADAAALYPNGLFQIEATYGYVLSGIPDGTVADTESWLKRHVSATSFPSYASAFAKATRAAILDRTEIFNAQFRETLGISFNYFDKVAESHFAFATEEEAKEAIATYLTALQAANWVSQEEATADITKAYYYGTEEKTFAVQASVDYKNDGTFAGTVTMNFFDYSEIVSEAAKA